MMLRTRRNLFRRPPAGRTVALEAHHTPALVCNSIHFDPAKSSRPVRVSIHRRPAVLHHNSPQSWYVGVRPAFKICWGTGLETRATPLLPLVCVRLFQGVLTSVKREVLRVWLGAKARAMAVNRGKDPISRSALVQRLGGVECGVLQLCSVPASARACCRVLQCPLRQSNESISSPECNWGAAGMQGLVALAFDIVSPRLRRSASAENPQIRGGRIPSADFEIVATEPLRQFSADAPRSPPSPPSRHIPSTVPLAFTAMVHVW